MAKMVSKKINVTKNYRLFNRDNLENRRFYKKKHKRLYQSMQLLGFLSCFPIVCRRGPDKKLVVEDGQHRLAFAEELGLPVYWVEEEVEFDIGKINSTPVIWQPKDHAEKYAAQGKKAYQEGLEFSTVHRLPVGTAFSLLSGTTTFSNVSEAFYAGDFAVRDRAWADAVAKIYGPLVRLNPKIRNARFVEACMAICRVDGFDSARLIRGAERCRDKLAAYSTREAYLDMLEEIYNFGRKTLVGLKAAATMAMRNRNATTRKKK